MSIAKAMGLKAWGCGNRAVLIAGGLLLGILIAPAAQAQLPSALYTWDATGNPAPNVENWVKNFGTNTVTLSNSILGELTITETGTVGSDVAISDGGNRVRESSTASSGGTDVTGLDFLEFELGHNGSAPINVQFYVQASTGFNFVGLGPDVAVAPGMGTYQVPLSGLTADQAVYLRTIGFSARAHAAVGNVTWTLREVRTGGTPLTTRNLITHNAGTPEGGLQGAIGNFDLASIAGNNGGQNQSGLSHNPGGTGSLQWTDVAGGAGAAIGWGNGTAWNGNTFNNRTTDLTGYTHMVVTMSATDAANGGGTLGVQGFFQRNGFSFQAADGGNLKNLAIDGQFHDLTFSLAGMTLMEVVELTGINLASHAQELVINVDNIRFVTIPEPSSFALCSLVGLSFWGARRRSRMA